MAIIFIIEEKNLFALLLIEERQDLPLIRCMLQQHDLDQRRVEAFRNIMTYSNWNNVRQDVKKETDTIETKSSS